MSSSDDLPLPTRQGGATGKATERVMANDEPRRIRTVYMETESGTVRMQENGMFREYILMAKKAVEKFVQFKPFLNFLYSGHGSSTVEVNVKNSTDADVVVVPTGMHQSCDGVFDLYMGLPTGVVDTYTYENAKYAVVSGTTPATPVKVYASSLWPTLRHEFPAVLSAGQDIKHPAAIAFGNNIHGKVYRDLVMRGGSTEPIYDGHYPINYEDAIGETGLMRPDTRLVQLAHHGANDVGFNAQAILFDHFRYYRPGNGWPRLGPNKHIYRAPDGTAFLIAMHNDTNKIKYWANERLMQYNPSVGVKVMAARLIDLTNTNDPSQQIGAFAVSGATSSYLHFEFSPSGNKCAYIVLSFGTDTKIAQRTWADPRSGTPEAVVEFTLSGGGVDTYPTATGVKKMGGENTGWVTTYGGNVAVGRAVSQSWSEQGGTPVDDGTGNWWQPVTGTVTTTPGAESFVQPKIKKRKRPVGASYGTDEDIKVFWLEEEVIEDISASYVAPTGSYTYTFDQAWGWVINTNIHIPGGYILMPMNNLRNLTVTYAANEHTWDITTTFKFKLTTGGDALAETQWSVFSHSYEKTHTAMMYTSGLGDWRALFRPVNPAPDPTYDNTNSFSGDEGFSSMCSNNVAMLIAVPVTEIGLDSKGWYVKNRDWTRAVYNLASPQGSIGVEPDLNFDPDQQAWVSWNPITDEYTKVHGERWV